MDVAMISIPQLALAFIPVIVVLILMWHWGQGYGRGVQAIARMLLQLTLIGYVLIYIFQTDSGLVIAGVLTVMLFAASWIALNTVDFPRGPLFFASLISVLLGGGTTLFLITQGVLRLEPWYQASFMIPLAGMIFAASMTNISLALERLHAELVNGVEFERARSTAFRTWAIAGTIPNYDQARVQPDGGALYAACRCRCLGVSPYTTRRSSATAS